MDLSESLKNPLQLICRDANASIGHRESEDARFLAVGVPLDPQDYFTSFGELDGIADQIDQDLMEAFRVSHQMPRHIR